MSNKHLGRPAVFIVLTNQIMQNTLSLCALRGDIGPTSVQKGAWSLPQDLRKRSSINANAFKPEVTVQQLYSLMRNWLSFNNPVAWRRRLVRQQKERVGVLPHALTHPITYPCIKLQHNNNPNITVIGGDYGAI